MRKTELVNHQVRPCNFNTFYYFKNALNDDDIEKVHSMVYDNNYKFEKGGTGHKEKGELDQYGSNNRDIAYVPCVNHSEWIYNKLEPLVVEANAALFQFDISYVTDPLHYVIYPEPNKQGETGETREIGGFLDWHMDIGVGGVCRRKLSTSVQLNDPKDYEGGEVEMWVGGENRFIKLPREKGDVVIFPTFYMHRVTPLTKGERRCLIFWTGGEPFR